MGPRLKYSRRHTSKLKHRWPRPLSSLGEVCIFFLLVGFVCVYFHFVSVSAHVFCPVWSDLFAAERYYRCVSGTIADKHQAVLPPTQRYYPGGAGDWGVMSGQGNCFCPIPIRPHSSSSLLLQPLTAGGARPAVVFVSSLSISSSVVDPHLVLLPWMPILPPFSFSLFLDIASSF